MLASPCTELETLQQAAVKGFQLTFAPEGVGSEQIIDFFHHWGRCSNWGRWSNWTLEYQLLSWGRRSEWICGDGDLTCRRRIPMRGEE